MVAFDVANRDVAKVPAGLAGLTYMAQDSGMPDEVQSNCL